MSSITIYDTETSGEYQLSYVAENSLGNITEVVIYLYVLGTQEQVPGDFPEMDEANLIAIKETGDTGRDGLIIKKPLDSYNKFTYYSSIDNLEGQDFFDGLFDLINVTQLSYGDVRYVLELSDAKHSIWGSYLYGIYDSKKLIRYWNSSGPIQREHVWPNSYLGDGTRPNNNTKNISTDMHNIRAIYGSTNGSRSNRYFVSGSGVNDLQGDGAYYPGDDHRGDVARILFYMHVRYNTQLYLTNDSYNISNKVIDPLGRIPFGLLDVLLQWHIDDPVDEFEIHRNNVIYMYQGNRNPFIDNPSYVDIIFAEEEHNEFIIVYMEVFVDTNTNLSDLKPRFEQLIN